MGYDQLTSALQTHVKSKHWISLGKSRSQNSLEIVQGLRNAAEEVWSSHFEFRAVPRPGARRLYLANQYRIQLLESFCNEENGLQTKISTARSSVLILAAPV